MSDMSDIQAKIGLVGKSASRHLDTLRAQLFRECQTLFELATKPCSVVFDAFREDNYTEGICTTSTYFAHRIIIKSTADYDLSLDFIDPALLKKYKAQSKANLQQRGITFFGRETLSYFIPK